MFLQSGKEFTSQHGNVCKLELQDKYCPVVKVAIPLKLLKVNVSTVITIQSLHLLCKVSHLHVCEKYSCRYPLLSPRVHHMNNQYVCRIDWHRTRNDTINCAKLNDNCNNTERDQRHKDAGAPAGGGGGGGGGGGWGGGGGGGGGPGAGGGG